MSVREDLYMPVWLPPQVTAILSPSVTTTIFPSPAAAMGSGEGDEGVAGGADEGGEAEGVVDVGGADEEGAADDVVDVGEELAGINITAELVAPSSPPHPESSKARAITKFLADIPTPLDKVNET